MYKIQGKAIVIGEEQQVSDNFCKREVVIETQEQYPQQVSIQFTQDKTDLLDQISLNDVVEVSFNIRGRKWVNPKNDEERYFNSLDGWKVIRLQDNSTAPKAQPQGGQEADDLDNLPF